MWRPTRQMAWRQDQGRLHALHQQARRHDQDATSHGIRSSFRDWAGDEADFARKMIEDALPTRWAMKPSGPIGAAMHSGSGRRCSRLGWPIAWARPPNPQEMTGLT